MHLHLSQNRMSLLPTLAVNAPCLAHISGDVALSFLNVFVQRMLRSKKNHQERVSREGSGNIIAILFWVRTTECALTLFVLLSKVVLSRFCSTRVLSEVDYSDRGSRFLRC